MKRVTIKDLAALLALAPSTVSRALSDHPDLSAATKARVQAAAARLHYIPDFRARSLREKHSRLVALVVPEVNTFFVPSLLTGLNEVLRAAGYSLVVFPSGDVLDEERRLVNLCLHLGVDGVLLARSAETADLAHLEPLRENDVPVVLVDKILDTDRYATVALDDRRAAAEATGYLLDHGHRAVVGVFSSLRLRIGAHRREGFQQAFAARGLDPAGALAVEVARLNGFDALVGAALDAHPHATAVFAMSDELLVRAHPLLARRGLRIPDDVSLVAISDGQAPHFLHPTVTHRVHAGAQVGAEAAHLLVRAMAAAEPAPPLEVKLRTTLVEGGSVRTLGTA